MLSIGKLLRPKACQSLRNDYSLCCPPPRPPCEWGPGKGSSKKFPSPKRAGKDGCLPKIAPNPCVPRFHSGKDTWKKYRFLTFFVCFPLIVVQGLNVLSQEPHGKAPCRDYEYMRVRSKRFPWGTGNETFFHNEHVNSLPGECEPPELDCD